MTTCRHDWQPTNRTAWTKYGAPLVVYACYRCLKTHGGRPHPGRCGERCGQ